MQFKIGKLYRSPLYFLIIYPSKEKALTHCKSQAPRKETAKPTPPDIPVFALDSSDRRTHWTDWWSNYLGYKVVCSKPGDMFMVLKQEKIYIHVLFGNKQGWIIFKDYLGIEKIKQND